MRVPMFSSFVFFLRRTYYRRLSRDLRDLRDLCGLRRLSRLLDRLRSRLLERERPLFFDLLPLSLDLDRLELLPDRLDPDDDEPELSERFPPHRQLNCGALFR